MRAGAGDERARAGRGGHRDERVADLQPARGGVALEQAVALEGGQQPPRRAAVQPALLGDLGHGCGVPGGGDRLEQIGGACSTSSGAMRACCPASAAKAARHFRRRDPHSCAVADGDLRRRWCWRSGCSTTHPHRLSMLAASIEEEGAVTIGINVPRMRTLTFLLGGLVGGLAGVLVSPLITIHYEMGLLLTLKGFAAAILGGLTNPFGAVVGGLTLGLVESLAVLSVSSGYKDVVAMTMLIVIMILMPNGMLGRRLAKAAEPSPGRASASTAAANSRARAVLGMARLLVVLWAMRARARFAQHRRHAGLHRPVHASPGWASRSCSDSAASFRSRKACSTASAPTAAPTAATHLAGRRLPDCCSASVLSAAIAPPSAGRSCVCRAISWRSRRWRWRSSRTCCSPNGIGSPAARWASAASRRSSLFGFALNTPQRFYYLVWPIALSCCCGCTHNLLHSRTGFAMRAMRDAPAAARGARRGHPRCSKSSVRA